MNVLFVNGNTPQCGVTAYGLNLYSILKGSERLRWNYYDGVTMPPFSALRHFGSVVYNHSPLIGGWMSASPFRLAAKQFYVFHDGEVNPGYDGILFSDPTMIARDKWHSIGRPIPAYFPTPAREMNHQPVIGCHGFIGAWSDRVVQKVVDEFEFATVRLHLPFSKFCDPDGVQAKHMAWRCRGLVGQSGVKLEVSHDFLPQPKLLEWLAGNDLNCYFRPTDMHWRGVSSALDCAMAARKPIAINRSTAFRHLHNTSPTILVEDHSLEEIIANGLSPLVPFYQRWSAENIRQQVESVIANAGEKA